MQPLSQKLLIADQIWNNIEPEHRVLDPMGVEIVIAPNGREETLVALAADADAILTCFAQITRPVLEAAPKCRIVARYGIGVDNIDTGAASELGIVATNVPSYCLDEVADHAFALLLALARKLRSYDRAIRAGRWDSTVGAPIHRVRGRTLGLIGIGKIGANIAAKANAFGMRVLAYDPYMDQATVRERGAEPVDFQRLLAESDFVSIHAPLSAKDGTAGMFGDNEFAAMKRGAFIINTARGGIIDQEALTRALQSGTIAGAGIDVLPTEPPATDAPLLQCENLILTPHAAFYSEESLIDLQTQCAQEVARALRGEQPINIVNPAALEKARFRA